LPGKKPFLSVTKQFESPTSMPISLSAAHFRINRIRLIACSAFILLFIGQCQSQFRPAQVDITDADTVGYSFIHQDENELTNAAYLNPLLKRLFEQRVRGGQKISIVQIGDSHVLGNFMSREVRDRLQRAFGDAGRGLVFPYKLAGSNGPKDYQLETNCKWQGGNCQRDLDEATPYGVSGFAIETNSSKGLVTFKLLDTATSETKLFTKVTVLQRKTATDYDLEIRDDNSNQKAQLYLEGDFSRSYYFDRPVGQVTIAADQRTSQQKTFRLDGVSLENELSGVIFHSIGVNGAKYQDFARAKYFAKQIAELQPDLFILSFGTNESQGKTEPGYMYRTIDNLVTQLLEYSPGALILLTTPADSYLRGKGFNPHMAATSATIRKYAQDKGYALWDLFGLSGGENSALMWKSNGLMSSDSVHYSKAGYAVQGKLLYQSLIKAYNNYTQEKP
jgi:lysophospholipase L1-like esterase